MNIIFLTLVRISDIEERGIYHDLMRMFRDEQEDYDYGDEEEEKEPLKWYEAIEGIDGKLAIKNNGSEEGFRKILKFFYRILATWMNDYLVLLQSLYTIDNAVWALLRRPHIDYSFSL